MKQEVRLPLLLDWFLLKPHPVLPWVVYWALARLLLCGSACLIHAYSSQLVGAPTQVPPAAGEIRLYGSPTGGSLLALSQLLPSKAPWGGWGSPLPGRGRGREKEVDLNPPLSLSPFLPVGRPPAPFLPPCSPASVSCPGTACIFWPPGPGLREAVGLCVPVALLAKPGLSLLVVVSVATQSRFPGRSRWGLAASLFFTEEVVEGVACFG